MAGEDITEPDGKELVWVERAGEKQILARTLVGDTPFTATGGTVARSAARRNAYYVDSLDHCAGDGITDDTEDLNYAAALALSRGVPLRILPGTYISSNFYAPGISIIGQGCTIKITNGTGPCGQIGGDNCEISGCTFEFTNTHGSPIIGLSVQGTSLVNFSFHHNKLVSKDTTVNDLVYPLWITATGLDRVSIHDNVLVGGSFGIQFNYQDDENHSIEDPIGDPNKDVSIHNNILSGCSIGVNSPHNVFRGLKISRNQVRDASLPINIANVQGGVVDANTLDNTDAVTVRYRLGEYGLHIEDCSRDFVVNGNTVLIGPNGGPGVYVGLNSGVSGFTGDFPADMVLSNNVVKATTLGTFGMQYIDERGDNANSVRFTDNIVATFANAFDVTGTNAGTVTIDGATIRGCTNATHVDSRSALVKGINILDGGNLLADNSRCVIESASGKTTLLDSTPTTRSNIVSMAVRSDAAAFVDGWNYLNLFKAPTLHSRFRLDLTASATTQESQLVASFNCDFTSGAWTFTRIGYQTDFAIDDPSLELNAGQIRAKIYSSGDNGVKLSAFIIGIISA